MGYGEVMRLTQGSPTELESTVAWDAEAGDTGIADGRMDKE